MRMTGSTVKHNGKYYMAYGVRTEGTPIGLLVSDDLMNWERIGDPVCKASNLKIDKFEDL